MLPAIGAALKGAASWLVPAVLGAGGQISANRSNRQQAREQMQFQERMSNTAAQRSQDDYRKAGLNPALAYGTTASSPGGSMATMQNVGEKGVHSGQSAVIAAETAKNLKEQNNLLQNQNTKAFADAQVAMAHAAPWMMEGPGQPRDLYVRKLREELATDISSAQQTRALQPHDLRLRSLEALIRGAQVPRARALESGFGAVNSVGDFIRQGMSHSKGASEAMDAWQEAFRSRMRGGAAVTREAFNPKRWRK